MRFLFTCGGTAGHINPAIAVASRLRGIFPEAEFLFVGSEGHMECELVPREGFPIKTVKISNIMRGFSFEMIKHNLVTMRNLSASLSESKRIVREFRPDAAIGTGGYVCYPVLSAASKLGVFTVLHESNAVPGLTTRMLQGKVDKILLGINGEFDAYKHPEKLVFTGTPVREGFTEGEGRKLKKALGLSPEKPLVVSVWGSLGADHINDIIPGFAARVVRDGRFNLIHSAGKRGYGKLVSRLDAMGLGDYASKGCDIREYIYDMPAVMSASDIVMCRAGGSTLSELAVLGKPAILVPSPNVTNHHQEKNAYVLEKAGAARVIPDAVCGADDLYNAASELLADPKSLAEMSEKMRKMGNTKAVDSIVEQILGVIVK